MAELKPGWRRVKFGEVVRQVKDRVDARASGLKRYVAGPHMDSGDLRIRRWGDIGPDYLGPAFHMRFRPGQVLYGSRRTYLRKLAVADFAGICANTTFVLESKDPTVLLPELLPFVMQAESFHEHSVRESKGSVNPYVNFSDLAWYEFALPPLDEQRIAVSLLCAADRGFHAWRKAEAALRRMKHSMLIEQFGADLHKKGPPRWLRDHKQLARSDGGAWCALEQVVDRIIDYRGKTPPYTDAGVPVVSQEDVQDDGLAVTTKWVSEETAAAWVRRGTPEAGDIVFRMERFPGAVVQLPTDRVVLTRGVFAIRPRAALMRKDYLFWYLYWLRHGGFWRIHAHATTVPRLYKDEVLAVPVPMRSLADQDAFIASMKGLLETEAELANRRRALDLLKRAVSGAVLAEGA